MWHCLQALLLLGKLVAFCQGQILVKVKGRKQQREPYEARRCARCTRCVTKKQTARELQTFPLSTTASSVCSTHAIAQLCKKILTKLVFPAPASTFLKRPFAPSPLSHQLRLRAATVGVEAPWWGEKSAEQWDFGDAGDE